LRSDVAALLAGAASFALVIAAATFLYAVVHVGGSWAYNTAIRTPGYIDELLASLATGLIKIAIVIGALFAVAEVLALPYEGVIAGLGVGGLALAIAARDTLSNFIGAAILLADRPFKRGDLVEFSGHMATVEQVGLRSTRLRTFDDSLLVVPNGLLGNDIVNNWGRRRSRRVVLVISVTYGTPRTLIDTFTGRLRDVYLAQPTADSTLYLGLKGFAASAIEIELWGHFRVGDYEEYIAAQHALIGDIIDLAAEMGVSFAFPTRTVVVANAPQNAPVLKEAGAAS
jgi:small-conductance mechanosensitive channel